MSAFVHGDDHFDLLVSLAVLSDASTYYNDRGWVSVGLSTSGRRFDVTLTPTELGRLLLAENVRSVRHRYTDIDDTPEGVIADLQVADYRHTPLLGLEETFGTALWAAGLKALASYRYQACEGDTWATSRAHTWCVSIRDAFERNLPGYREVNTWAYVHPAEMPARTTTSARAR